VNPHVDAQRVRLPDVVRNRIKGIKAKSVKAKDYFLIP
jgi:hypothetical protein